MKFEMNGNEWIIKEVPHDDFSIYDKNNDNKYTYTGITIFLKQEIWLCEDLTKEQKRKSLYHELLHCYIFSYLSSYAVDMDIEIFCDIASNSHDIIHEIVQNYFEKESK